jgi:hypothetical protein
MNALLREIRAQKKTKLNPDHQKTVTYCGKQIILQEDPEGGVAGCVWDAVIHFNISECL